MNAFSRASNVSLQHKTTCLYDVNTSLAPFKIRSVWTRRIRKISRGKRPETGYKRLSDNSLSIFMFALGRRINKNFKFKTYSIQIQMIITIMTSLVV